MFKAPDGVEEDTWLAWLDIRKKNRCPMNEGTYRIVRRNLLKWSCEGHAPNEVVEQSVLRGWRGLFPLVSNNSYKSADSVGDNHKRQLLGPRGKPTQSAIERDAKRRLQ